MGVVPYNRFPRMRGDVPGQEASGTEIEMFSPHARGCSSSLNATPVRASVFPACAGMFLWHPLVCMCTSGFPRMRGDVPIGFPDRHTQVVFSPHARGCSWQGLDMSSSTQVFPACAGMFPRTWRRFTDSMRFPRMRGDVPTTLVFSGPTQSFSPHARGCSLLCAQWL